MLIPIFELFYEQKSGLRTEAERLALSKTVTPFNASNQVNITKDILHENGSKCLIKTTMRYVHTANEQILSAMNALNSNKKDLIQND